MFSCRSLLRVVRVRVRTVVVGRRGQPRPRAADGRHGRRERLVRVLERLRALLELVSDVDLLGFVGRAGRLVAGQVALGSFRMRVLRSIALVREPRFDLRLLDAAVRGEIVEIVAIRVRIVFVREVPGVHQANGFLGQLFVRLRRRRTDESSRSIVIVDFTGEWLIVLRRVEHR